MNKTGKVKHTNSALTGAGIAAGAAIGAASGAVAGNTIASHQTILHGDGHGHILSKDRDNELSDILNEDENSSVMGKNTDDIIYADNEEHLITASPVEYDAIVTDDTLDGNAGEPIIPEVTDYQQVVFSDGSAMDVAVLDVDGMEVGVVDMDMDGEADILVADMNNDGILNINEMEVISGMGVDMGQFTDALHMSDDSNLAQCDMPDYVDDADVTGFLA